MVGQNLSRLWSLTEFECEQDVFKHVLRDTHIVANHKETLEHTFSHYQLIMHILHIRLDQKRQEPLYDYLSGQWIARNAIAQYALLRPISHIVNHASTMQALS